jgi:hypothetical protein
MKIKKGVICILLEVLSVVSVELLASFSPLNTVLGSADTNFPKLPVADFAGTAGSLSFLLPPSS